MHINTFYFTFKQLISLQPVGAILNVFMISNNLEIVGSLESHNRLYSEQEENRGR